MLISVKHRNQFGLHRIEQRIQDVSNSALESIPNRFQTISGSCSRAIDAGYIPKAQRQRIERLQEFGGEGSKGEGMCLDVRGDVGRREIGEKREQLGRQVG